MSMPIKYDKHFGYGILFVGRAGCGKDTQGKLLATDDDRFFHYSSGDKFREILNGDEANLSAYEIKLKQDLAAGHFADDRKAVELAYNTLEDNVIQGVLDPAMQITLLNGIPRNIAQTDMITGFIHPILVFYLDLPRDKAYKRLERRAIEEGREDDAKPDSINKRLDLFDKYTFGMIEKYGDRVNVINADQDKQFIARKIECIADRTYVQCRKLGLSGRQRKKSGSYRNVLETLPSE